MSRELVPPGARQSTEPPEASALLAPFQFVLPDERIARYPPEDRDGGRLLYLGDSLQHLNVSDLSGVLKPGDLLIVNDTRVMAARLRAHRSSGGAVELLLLEPGPGPVLALVRPSRKLKPGERLAVGAGYAELLEQRPGGEWLVRCDPEPEQLMEALGEMPLPPYMGRAAEAGDRSRYQTVFAREIGAVAAPTAGLHLSERLMGELSARGIDLARITLHVGIGTFRPLRPEDLVAGRLHEERFHVPQSTVDAIRACRARGGRVVAVGTTSARALESATVDSDVPRPGAGVTGLFIREGYHFRCVDALFTNFHLPGSSLLMLVCAFGGRERVMAAYAEAIARDYRFYSYGDAMLLLPDHPHR